MTGADLLRQVEVREPIPGGYRARVTWLGASARVGDRAGSRVVAIAYSTALRRDEVDPSWRERKS